MATALAVAAPQSRAFDVVPAPDTPPIKWSADRKLTWDDFKGTPDAESDRDAESDVFVVVRSWNCDREGNFTFSVDAVFAPDTSWVKDGRKSDLLLKHEQGHFDIAEIHARKLRKALSELKDPCKDLEATKKKIDELAAKYGEEHKKAQEQYDKKTHVDEGGLDEKAQEKESEKIQKELEKLT